jgi:hypothetical protein
VKARLECISATAAPRRRRRRFPERDLLDRLRKYENLLRQQGVEFEPLHKDSSLTNTKSPRAPDGSEIKNEYLETKKTNSSSVTPSTPGTDMPLQDSAGGK